MKVVWYIVGGVLLVTGLIIFSLYRRDLRIARARIAAGSTMIDTACGPIEYAESGEGPAVLIVHGAGGGYDQGLLLGQAIFGEGYRVIAPSRFDYLNSPVPADHDLEAQADAYACLLDKLGLDKVPVVAVSAGGPSALTFARLHPDRTSALIMMSAISFIDEIDVESDQKEAMINRMVSNDFVYWAAIHGAKGYMLELFGVSKEAQADISAEEMAQTKMFLDSMLPMSARLDGIAVDQGRSMPRDYPLEEITAPTLVLHSKDDKLIPYENGQHSASEIPGAELISFEQGGHLMMGNFEAINAQVTAFLAANTAK